MLILLVSLTFTPAITPEEEIKIIAEQVKIKIIANDLKVPKKIIQKVPPKRIVQNYPDHGHRCSKGHVWGGFPGHGHNCPVCGEYNNVQIRMPPRIIEIPQPPRIIETSPRIIEQPKVVETPPPIIQQSQSQPITYYFQTNNNCPNGNCGRPRRW